MADESKTRILLSEGIMLAGATAYVYLVTYLYEYGYCAHFAIPTTLISPSLTTVLVAAAAIGGVFVSSFKLLGLSAPLLRAASDPRLQPYREFFGMNAILLIGGILLASIYGFSVRVALVLVGLVALFELLYFGPALILDRKRPLAEKFEELAQAKPDRLDLPVYLEERYGRRWVPSMLVLVCLLLLAYVAGDGEATRKERYLTLMDSPDIVVLRNYGDLLIAGRFNRVTKTVSDDLVLLRLTDADRYEFRNEMVGPLLRAKPKIVETDAQPTTASPKAATATQPKAVEADPRPAAASVVKPKVATAAQPSTAVDTPQAARP